MATYYVDAVNGSDANNGLGPDASHATNKPWLTLGKLLGATGMASGDTAYLSPSGPFRATVSLGLTSPVAETKVIGDPNNEQGFKTSAGVLVAGGPVVWTAYTTNDTTAPAASAALTMSTRDFMTFQKIVFIGGNASPGIVSAAAGSTDCKFTECTFLSARPANNMMTWTAGANEATNLTFDRCTWMNGGGAGAALALVLTRPTGADFDHNITVNNCLFMTGGRGVDVTTTGANTQNPGGVDIFNCTFLTATGVQTGVNISTTVPVNVYDSVIWGITGLSANASGQIVEDYNWVLCSTPRTNVTAGTNSVALASNTITHAPLFEIGHAVQQGHLPRPFATPLRGSPLLNFGNQSGSPSVDFLNRPRPAGSAQGASAGANKGLGYVERHDTARQETTTVDASGSAIAIVGPGDHDIKIPVDATSTTISIKARYDSSYSGTNYPQAQLLANGEIGFAGQTLTKAAGADSWETLTFSAFTPTQKGVVVLRLISRDGGGTGSTFFDTLVIA